MRLVVIIPALNEQATIADVVRRVPRTIDGVDSVDVVVIDDGSTDATGEHARSAGASVVRHQRNQGVGAAFKTGVQAALTRGADLVVNMDGDGQFRPEDIPRLLAPILAGEAGFVSCTRFADPKLVPQMPTIKRLGNAWMTWLIKRICRTNRLTDVSCGFRAYTRDTLLRLNLYGRFTYTQETFINLAVHNVEMTEVPLAVRGTREFGNSRVAGSIRRYIQRTVPIIFRTMRDLRPFAFFGSIATIVLIVGIVLGGVVLLNYSLTGRTHPYQSLLIGSAVGIILGFLLFVLALVADMLNRLRRLLEELLYLARREHFERPAATNPDADNGSEPMRAVRPQPELDPHAKLTAQETQEVRRL